MQLLFSSSPHSVFSRRPTSANSPNSAFVRQLQLLSQGCASVRMYALFTACLVRESIYVASPDWSFQILSRLRTYDMLHPQMDRGTGVPRMLAAGNGTCLSDGVLTPSAFSAFCGRKTHDIIMRGIRARHPLFLHASTPNQ